jgi:hypothetical protein
MTLLAVDAQDALATVSAEASTNADPMAALESKYLELVRAVFELLLPELTPEEVSRPPTKAKGLCEDRTAPAAGEQLSWARELKQP